jgi:hypothetical protein
MSSERRPDINDTIYGTCHAITDFQQVHLVYRAVYIVEVFPFRNLESKHFRTYGFL